MPGDTIFARLAEWIAAWRGGGWTDAQSTGGSREDSSSPPETDRTLTVANDLEELSWVYPPQTLVDPAPWDQYWHHQATGGLVGFVDMFCDDGELVDVMRANGLRTVLCVGSGISHEPRALARVGFDVTALDLSPLAINIARQTVPPDEFLAHLVGGRAARPNGHLEFIAGDLCDAANCPGPYDVVIERKTLQLYPDDTRSAAIDAVANRLSSRGIFFSHCHDGRWRPPDPPRHWTQSWFEAHGWKMWRGGSAVTGRVAWLLSTTG